MGRIRDFFTGRSPTVVDQTEAIETLKRAWNNQYKNSEDNVIILNKGMDCFLNGDGFVVQVI